MWLSRVLWLSVPHKAAIKVLLGFQSHLKARLVEDLLPSPLAWLLAGLRRYASGSRTWASLQGCLRTWWLATPRARNARESEGKDPEQEPVFSQLNLGSDIPALLPYSIC